jgi:dolichol-phosphate mannosyltransferase
VLGVIDADLQHPPELLLKLWGEIKRGGDLAVASRHVEGGGVSDWSVIRRFLSRGAQTLGLIILPEVIGRVSDPMSGYFMVRRRCIAGRTLSPLGYKILIEVLARGKSALDWRSGLRVPRARGR